MMIDIALEPRTELAVNVARAKNKKFHDFHKQIASMDPSQSSQELLVQTAYGNHDLGLPRIGYEENLVNIDSTLLNKFMSQITPKKCVIAANGV